MVLEVYFKKDLGYYSFDVIDRLFNGIRFNAFVYGACVEYTLMDDLSHGMCLCASANIYECL